MFAHFRKLAPHTHTYYFLIGYLDDFSSSFCSPPSTAFLLFASLYFIMRSISSWASPGMTATTRIACWRTCNQQIVVCVCVHRRRIKKKQQQQRQLTMFPAKSFTIAPPQWLDHEPHPCLIIWSMEICSTMSWLWQSMTMIRVLEMANQTPFGGD